MKLVIVYTLIVQIRFMLRNGSDFGRIWIINLLKYIEK